AAPPPRQETPPTEAQRYFKHLTDAFNPRFTHYEEKNPLILVIERDKGDHKAEVIKTIESTYGPENPPIIKYIDSNLLDEDAAFSLGALLQKQGISLSSARAINFSMGSWFDSTAPSSALAMRSNIAKFNNTIFVHGAGNMAGGQPIYGLTTQADHVLVVGATEKARHEAPVKTIRETDFTASTETPTSAVDLVMKGRDVPIDGISGQWSKDGKPDTAPRKISGTSFAAPQVTAQAAKLAARYRGLFIQGLPGRRYPDELSRESLEAKEERQQSLVDSVTLSLLASAAMIDPGDAQSVIATPGKMPFDTKGSGYGMPHAGLAERILFDQMLAAQLSGKVIPAEDYQAYAPESDRVFPRTVFKGAQEEHKAVGEDFLRHNVPMRVPVPLKTQPVPGEENTLSVEVPAFGENFSAHMLRGSLLFGVDSKPAPGQKEPSYELFIEAPDRKTRIPLGAFGCQKKELWHTDRPHPGDDFRMVNFRTRACMFGETAPQNAKNGWRFIIKTKHKPAADVKVFASGDKTLPVLEITGVPHGREMFIQHPAGASRLAFLTPNDIVAAHEKAFDALEDKLDSDKKAQRVVEAFIGGEKPEARRVLQALPQLLHAAKDDPALMQAVGLMAHNTVVEPVARQCAERLLHLATYAQERKQGNLQEVTKAYSGLYTAVLAYEKALASGRYQELPQHLRAMDAQLQAQAPHIAEYARRINDIYPNPAVASQEQQDIKALYLAATGQALAPSSPARPR
ncbi:MAG: hypothetical protein EBV03_05930, partial [Proteobacteria bacterium]|nr:hypothetical protein [Pseudomonadota bacterium]